MTLDSFDLRLLRLVQADGRLTADQLSGQVGLSASACLRRMRRLHESGTIEAVIAVIRPEAVGQHLTMVVQVTLERERPDIIDAFKRTMRATPEVSQCYYVTGDTDFVLLVTARDMRCYEEFTNTFFFCNPHVRRFQTSVVMDRVKVGLSVPLDAG